MSSALLRSIPITLSVALFFVSGCGDPSPDSPNGGSDPYDGLECRFNSDCELGFRCEEGACVEQEAEEVCEGEGCPCERDSECSARFVCDAEQGACVAIVCLSDADCALGERCSASLCVVDTEADRDLDGVPDGSRENPRDNCPLVPNPEQGDLDDDGQGDECDLDDDQDGVLDLADNCPVVPNRAQYDANQDGIGNVCDDAVSGTTLSGQVAEGRWRLGSLSEARVSLVGSDVVALADEEGRFELPQAFQSSAEYQLEVSRPGYVSQTLSGSLNMAQTVSNIGEVTLEPQMTSLSVSVSLDGREGEAGVSVSLLIDEQVVARAVTERGVPLVLETAAWAQSLRLSAPGFVSRVVELSWDGEALRAGEALASEQVWLLSVDDGPEGDRDGDGVANGADNCPERVNPDQVDSDSDGEGDVCDLDDDNDGLSDLTELQLGTSQTSADSDGDGLDDLLEHSVLGSSPTSADTDGDGEPDGGEVGSDPSAPLDFDGDGVPDVLESSTRDSDRDGAYDEFDGPADAGDLDGDGVVNGTDNCVNLANDQANLDGDALGDACDSDDDGDGFEDAQDNCPRDANAEQTDNDADGVGDACDSDDDGDGLPDDVDPYPLFVDFDRDGVLDGDGDQAVDNCPGVANADQRDNDSDGLGDACDDDDDNDEVLDVDDNCPLVANTNQLNSEPTPDSLGDACDLDDDNDGVLDAQDNCPLHINPVQADKDFDGLGNACDDDDDGDGVLDVDDNCQLISNAGQQDADGDGVGNACSQDIDGDGVADGVDNCPNAPNADQRNRDGDQFGDACDGDIDGDGFANEADNCVTVFNDPQLDLDGDLIGDACDLDDDNDGVDDRFDSCPRVVNLGRDDEPVGEEDNVDSACDNCPFASNEYQQDRDKDGVGDACDDDIDGDGFLNEVDNCPRVVNLDQIDTSGDGVGDACENNVTYYLSDHFPVSDTALWESPTSPVGDVFWVALDGGGLVEHVREADGSWTRVKQHTPTDGLPDRWVKHMAVDNAGNVYLITRKGLGVRYASSGLWESEEYRTDIVENCSTAWGYANGINAGNTLMWKYAIDLDVDRVTGAVYGAFKDRLIRSTAGELTCWPAGLGPLNAENFSVDVSPDGSQVWVGNGLGASRYTEGDGWTNYLNGDLRFAPARQVGFEEVNGSYEAVVMSALSGTIKGARVNSSGGVTATEFNLTVSESLAFTENSSGGLGVSVNSAFSPEGSIPGSKFFAVRVSDGSTLLRASDNTLYAPNDEGSLSVVNDYVSGGAVNQIALEEDGEYWLARADGLYSSRVDFKYTTASGLHTNTITNVVVDQGGVVWLGTESGLSRFQNGQFERLSEWKVHGLAVDANNGLWVAQEDGLFTFDGAELSPVLSDDGETALCAVGWQYRDGLPSAISVKVNGSDVWASCRHKVYQLTGAGWAEYADVGVESLDVFSTGELWGGGGVGLFDDGGVLVRRDVGGSAFTLPTSDRQGWVAIYGGLAVVEGAEGGTDGVQVGGTYRVQPPCSFTKNGCPELGFVEITGGSYDFSRGVIVNVGDLLVMRSEITAEMYKGCKGDGFCSITPQSYGQDHPAHSLNWFDFQRFGEWIGARLLTEAEWEYVARSQGEAITYPWGDDAPDCSYSSFSNCEPTRTSRVCAKPLGNSAQGLCDLGGNVFEWVQDHRDGDALLTENAAGACLDASGCPVNASNSAYRVVRGGGLGDNASYMRAVYRGEFIPSSRNGGFGGGGYGGGRFARSVR